MRFFRFVAFALVVGLLLSLSMFLLELIIPVDPVYFLIGSISAILVLVLEEYL